MLFFAISTCSFVGLCVFLWVVACCNMRRAQSAEYQLSELKDECEQAKLEAAEAEDKFITEQQSRLLLKQDFEKLKAAHIYLKEQHEEILDETADCESQVRDANAELYALRKTHENLSHRASVFQASILKTVADIDESLDELRENTHVKPHEDTDAETV